MRGKSKYLLAVIFGLICAAGFAAQETREIESTATGDSRIHTFKSDVFGNERKLRVLVPDGYDDPETRDRVYPVLYLNDGQNLFDVVTSLFNLQEWRVDETVAALVAKGKIEQIIVVGIDNAGRSMRPNEYLPWEDKFLSPAMPDPQGEMYPQFLEDEVIPFVESRYRVVRESNGRGLGGSSYGALITLYTAIKEPHLFGRILLESPSLYVNDAEILRLANLLQYTGNPSRIYVGVGTNEEGKPDCTPEADGGEAVADVKKLEPKLDNRFFGARRRAVKVVIEPCAVHDEDAWARRLPAALEFLFPS